MNTIELHFRQINEEQSDILTALLSDIGFESFWNERNNLRAYIELELFNRQKTEETIRAFINEHKIDFDIQNAAPDEWDIALNDDYQPTVIGKRVWMGKPNTEPDIEIEYHLYVDPQMAFGSGAHPSTLLCIELMLNMNIKHKKVVDAGTGSGVLAALAKKMGAAQVMAFDNNPWAIEICRKTMMLNHINPNDIELVLNDVEQLEEHSGKFDLVLANLNYSVFSRYFSQVAALLAPGGSILVSGFMLKDEEGMKNLAAREELQLISHQTLDSWCALWLKKTGGD